MTYLKIIAVAIYRNLRHHLYTMPRLKVAYYRRYQKIFGWKFLFIPKRRQRTWIRRYEQRIRYNNAHGGRTHFNRLLLIRDGRACTGCRRIRPEEMMTIDHRIPIAKGGRPLLSNMQRLCVTCHQEKDNRLSPKTLARYNSGYQFRPFEGLLEKINVPTEKTK